MVFVNQSAITKRLADWYLLPQPENLSELYFTDHNELPKSFNAGANQPVRFTVHNLENRTTTYHYKLTAILPDSDTEQQLAEGTFMLDQDDLHNVQEDIVVPALGPRIGIRVDLFYNDKTETIASQSINYWSAVRNTNNQANSL